MSLSTLDGVLIILSVTDLMKGQLTDEPPKTPDELVSNEH